MPADLPDLFNNNMVLLKKHQPAVWQFLSEAMPEPRGEIITTPSGAPNLKLTNIQGQPILFHPEHNPESEAEAFLAAIPEGDSQVVTLLGMGLGYTPIAILENRPAIRHLAVFELDPGIFLQALRHMDLTSMLTDHRLILSVGSDPNIGNVLAPAFKALQLETINIRNHQASFLLGDEIYPAFHEKLFLHVNQLNVHGSTIRARGGSFLDNRFRHLTSLHHHGLLEDLHNKFSGIPAILVAGGPSLDKNIHLLPTLKNRAVIIAVDTVLPALKAHGVEPHFLTSIDNSNLTYEKFASLAPDTKKTALICLPWVNQRTPKSFPAKKVFWGFTPQSVESWIGQLLGVKLWNSGAGTVAHLNMIAASTMGCSPIVFIGQDLAYSGDSSHTKHTILKSTKSMAEALKNHEATVKGIDGQLLPSNRSFISMKKHFESMIAATPGHYINATEGGAHIEGTEVHSLQKVIDTYCSEEHDLEKQLSALTEKGPLRHTKKLLTEFDKIHKQVKQLHKEVKKLNTLMTSATKELSKLLDNEKKYTGFALLPAPLQRKLSEIDTLSRSVDKSPKIWQILQDITMEGLKQSEQKRHELLKIETPEKYIAWLIKSFDRVESINTVRENVLIFFSNHLSKILQHHKNEKKLLKKISQKGDHGYDLLELARLYVSTDDFMLAAPYLNELKESLPDCAEVSFYLGCLAAHHTEYEKFEDYFHKALLLDPNIEPKLTEFRQVFANEYLDNAHYFKTIDKNAYKYMLSKGLRFCPSHSQLLKEIQEFAAADLTEIQTAATPLAPEADAIISTWRDDLHSQPFLEHALAPKQTAMFLRYFGDHSRLVEKDFAVALSYYNKTLTFYNEAPDLLITMTDTLFSIGNFEEGLQHLNKAIALDKNYASYLENIGDNLYSSGQNSEAIWAYEKCFLVLPENIGLLKKMGQCYLAMGQHDAAKEALLQLKKQLETISHVSKAPAHEPNLTTELPC